MKWILEATSSTPPTLQRNVSKNRCCKSTSLTLLHAFLLYYATYTTLQEERVLYRDTEILTQHHVTLGRSRLWSSVSLGVECMNTRGILGCCGVNAVCKAPGTEEALSTLLALPRPTLGNKHHALYKCYMQTFYILYANIQNFFSILLAFILIPKGTY